MPGLAHFLVTTNVGNIASLALAAAVGGVFALAVGLPLMRLSGLAAGIATFAVLEITNNVLTYEGLIGPALNDFSSVPPTTGIWQAAIGGLICIAVAYAYQRTRFGRMLRATREDPAAAAAAGISIYRQRLLAFTLAGALAGFAGGLYVHLQPLAANDLFLDLTFITLAMLVVGGSGSLLGRGRRRARGQRHLLLLHRRGEHRRRLRVAPARPSRDGRDRARRADGARAHLPAERHHRRPRVLPATAAAPRGRPRESEGHDMRFSIYTRASELAGEVDRPALRRGARADRERRPARLRRLRRDRALLLPEVLGVGEPVRAVRDGRRAHAPDQLPDDAPRPPVPQPARPRGPGPRVLAAHRRPLRVRRRPRPRLDPAAGGTAARRDRAAALRGGARPLRRGAALRRRQLRGRVLEREGQPGDPVQRPQVPRRARRHVRPHVRPRGEARLGGRGAAAPAVRRAQGAARPLPREVRGVRHDAGHHLDPRLLHRRRRATSRCARRSSTCAASSRATRRR